MTKGCSGCGFFTTVFWYTTTTDVTSHTRLSRTPLLHTLHTQSIDSIHHHTPSLPAAHPASAAYTTVHHQAPPCARGLCHFTPSDTCAYMHVIISHSVTAYSRTPPAQHPPTGLSHHAAAYTAIHHHTPPYTTLHQPSPCALFK